jgi:ribosomal protein S18 acetylase RimI-like enzyme
MLNIRPLTSAASDVEAAASLLTSAFRSETRWDDELRRYLRWQPDGWLIAEEDGQFVGMVGATDYRTYAYIGMMAVHTDQQRRGIGQQLMEVVLRWLDGRGCPIILLDATPAGSGLYEKLGFRKVGVRAMFDYRAPNRPPSPEHAVYPITADDLDELATFDAIAFGGDRRRLLATLLEESPDRALLTRDAIDREITGYLFANQRRMAPFMATTVETAETLLQAGLQFEYSVLPGLITPVQNKPAIDLLVNYGFVSMRSCAHMIRTQSSEMPHPQQVQTLYGQLSYAVG